MKKHHYGLCNICDAVCGLDIEHEDGKILSIRGDKENPFSRGHICPKGSAQGDILNDPDRLRRPVRKKGSDWEEISWDTAFSEVSEKLAAIQRKHGNDALGVYFGNPVAHNYRTLLALVPFIMTMKTKNVFSANSADGHPRMLVSMFLYGNMAILPVPDIERTDYFLVLGANPAVTHGSIMSAPDTAKRLKEITERGGKIVVIDPRRTETAKAASEHHFIRPGTDSFFLLGLINTLYEQNLFVPSKLISIADGADEMKKIASKYTPERVAGITGISAGTIRKIASDFAGAPKAVCYGRMGTCTQEFGCLTSWLIDIVNILTGNFDKPGGAMFPAPAVDLALLAKIFRQTGRFDRWRSRV